MKRDWNLLRHILGIIELSRANNLLNFPEAAYPIPQEIAKNYENQEEACQVILEHVVLLHDENFIEILEPGRNGTYSIISIFVIRLTASGHDFMDLSRENNHWENVKNKIVTSGGATTVAIITQLLIAEAKQKLGL